MLITSLAIAACAPNAKTGDGNADEQIDIVVRREAPNHQCIEIGPEALVVEYSNDSLAPNMGLSPGAFSDEEVNSALRTLVEGVDRIGVVKEEVVNSATVVGQPDTIGGSGSCTMRVRYPVFAEDFAFIEFSAPGGSIGAYAFKQTFLGWQTKERLHFGWW